MLILYPELRYLIVLRMRTFFCRSIRKYGNNQPLYASIDLYMILFGIDSSNKRAGT